GPWRGALRPDCPVVRRHAAVRRRPHRGGPGSGAGAGGGPLPGRVLPGRGAPLPGGALRSLVSAGEPRARRGDLRPAAGPAGFRRRRAPARPPPDVLRRAAAVGRAGAAAPPPARLAAAARPARHAAAPPRPRPRRVVALLLNEPRHAVVTARPDNPGPVARPRLPPPRAPGHPRLEMAPRRHAGPVAGRG